MGEERTGSQGEGGREGVTRGGGNFLLVFSRG
jgi:hypothetical protein